MKLAQALNLRKQHKEDMARLITLLKSQSVEVAGDPKPEKSCGELIQAIMGLAEKQTALVQNINHTNTVSTLPFGGASLADALVKRNTIATMRLAMETLLQVESRERRGYDRAGNVVAIPTILALDLSKVRRIIDGAAREWRELDDAIQQANWTVDLIERPN